jgi:hypothetical protein
MKSNAGNIVLNTVSFAFLIFFMAIGFFVVSDIRTQYTSLQNDLENAYTEVKNLKEQLARTEVGIRKLEEIPRIIAHVTFDGTIDQPKPFGKPYNAEVFRQKGTTKGGGSYTIKLLKNPGGPFIVLLNSDKGFAFINTPLDALVDGFPGFNLQSVGLQLNKNDRTIKKTEPLDYDDARITVIVVSISTNKP